MSLRKNRFYDQEPVVSTAVEGLIKLPDNIQLAAANGINNRMQNNLLIKERMNSLKSENVLHVLALYKAKQCKRTSDKIKATHRFINLLLVSEEDERIELSCKAIELIDHMNVYLKICLHYANFPEEGTAETIATILLTSGAEASKKHLKQIAEIMRLSKTKISTDKLTWIKEKNADY